MACIHGIRNSHESDNKQKIRLASLQQRVEKFHVVAFPRFTEDRNQRG